LEICASSEKRLSTMLEDLPQTFRTVEIRRPCPDQHKFEVQKRAREYFAGNFDAIEVDGVRVIFDDGWGLLRASNTEPAIVLRCEAETKQRLDSIEQLFQDKVDQIISEISAGE
jgi:phosphomannomutase/phosphoglucomutase